MTKRFLCRLGLHKYTAVEVHFRGEPKKGGPASVIERCDCGESKLLRYQRPTTFHFWLVPKGGE